MQGTPRVQRRFRGVADAFRSTQQRRLIVYAYYRSGSTLAGHVFNFNPNAFYWFEPLAGVTTQFGWDDERVHPINLFHFDNGTEKCVMFHSIHFRFDFMLQIICNGTEKFSTLVLFFADFASCVLFACMFSFVCCTVLYVFLVLHLLWFH